MGNDKPSVGIVIINYNGFQDTAELLESFKTCDYSNYSIIIVDNKSTDDSLEHLKSIQKEYDFTLIESEENRGFSAGNNLGINRAIEDGLDYILLLNNDTIITPDFLSKLVNNIKDFSSAYTGTIRYFWDKDRIWYAGGAVSHYTGKTRHLHQDEVNPDLPAEPLEVNFISGCELLFPTSMVEKVGLLDEDFFLYSEDVDYSLRMEKAGIKMIYVPDSVIYHKVGATTSKISKISSYYSARNRRIMIYRNFKWYQIITALIYTHAQTIHRILHGRQSVKCVRAGITDYYLKRFGKTDRVFN